MDEYSQALIEVVEAATPKWIERVIRDTARTQDLAVDDVSSVVASATAGVVGQMRELLSADVDSQTTTPLAIMRTAVGPITDTLRQAGARPVARDDYDVKYFPEDDFGLTPANWGDIDESLVDPGIAWSASKVMAHRARHGA